MKLIAGLLAASHAEKLRFGANQCTFGPAHWCQDIVTASNCGKGAITYCSQNEVISINQFWFSKLFDSGTKTLRQLSPANPARRPSD